MNDLRKFIDATKKLHEARLHNDQRSVTEQLLTLLNLANANGLYDAADWLKNQLQLNEDDLPGAPEGHALGHGRKKDLDYKESKVKGLVNRVTLELSGSQAGVFTKLGKRYEQLQAALERLEQRRERMNVDLKSRTVELFDAEDEVLTRVLKTTKIVLTLGKMETRTPPPKFNTRAFLNEIYALADEISDIVPDLGERIAQLEIKYTELGEPKEVSPKLGIKVNPDESLREDHGADWEEFDIRLQDIYDRMDQLVT